MPTNIYVIAGCAILFGAVVLAAIAFRTRANRNTRNLLLLCSVIDAAIGVGLIVYGLQQAGTVGSNTKTARKASEVAAEFMAGPGKIEPLVSDPGSGIRLYGEAYRFYQTNRTGIPQHHLPQWDKWAALPERPTRLLSRSEEITYAEHAKELKRLIQGLVEQ